MANQKITALTENTTPALSDILPMVDDPSGTPSTQKITISNLLSLAWPIGSVYIAVVGTSPATLLGFGTRSAIGSGKVLVGQDTNDTDFDVLEETGGEKTHTLTTSEMPSHTHTQDSHNHTQNSHTHTLSTILRTATTGADTTYLTESSDTSSTKDSAKTTDATTATNQATTATNQNTGGDTAHNNMPPYLVVCMWKRTA